MRSIFHCSTFSPRSSFYLREGGNGFSRAFQTRWLLWSKNLESIGTFDIGAIKNASNAVYFLLIYFSS